MVEGIPTNFKCLSMNADRKNRNIVFILLVCGGGSIGILIWNMLVYESGNWASFLTTPGNVGLFLTSFGSLTMAFSRIKEQKRNPDTRKY